LEKFGWGLDSEVRKAEFAMREIPGVVGDDGFRVARHGQFDEMVVGLVGEIGALGECQAACPPER
jgi:hypothetical protein